MLIYLYLVIYCQLFCLHSVDMCVETMVIVNPTARKARRCNPIFTVIIVVSTTIGIAWFIALLVIGKSTNGSKIKLRGQISQSGEVGNINEPKSIMQLSAKYMLQSKRPYIVYGTAWKKDVTSSLVSNAVESGFRFIDTACQVCPRFATGLFIIVSEYHRSAYMCYVPQR